MKKTWSSTDFLLILTMFCSLGFSVVIAANFYTGFEPFHDLYVLYYKKEPKFSIANAIFNLVNILLLTPGSYAICSAIILVLLYANLAFYWVTYRIKTGEMRVSSDKNYWLIIAHWPMAIIALTSKI